MATIANANYVAAGAKTYADGTIWDEIDMDNLANYLQTYINARKNDLVRLANDCQGTSYVLDGSSTTFTYTHSLFEKQFEYQYITPGVDITIGTTTNASFSDVSGMFGVIAFTPERTGTYKVSCDFTHAFALNTTSEGQCITAFRLYNGATASSIQVSGGYYPAPAANAIQVFNPIHLEMILTLDASVPYNFFLQKRNIAMTNVNTNAVAGLTTTGQINISVEKI